MDNYLIYQGWGHPCASFNMKTHDTQKQGSYQTQDMLTKNKLITNSFLAHGLVVGGK